MSRIGKIARLPKAVRDELNRRLEDGEPQNRLVEWLNGRTEVQAVLKAEFSGRPINEPNMTAWAQGGFEDWRRQQELLEAAGRVVEETAELDALTKDRRLADRAADMAALAMAEQLMAVRRMEDGEEKRRAVLKLVRGLVRLRKSDRECERGQREAAQAERAAETHEEWMYARGRRREVEEDRFDHLSDAELMERITELRTLGTTPPATPRTEATEHEHRGRGPSFAEASAGRQETGVRRRIAEIIARMSDAEIADSLRRGGYMGPARRRRGPRQTTIRQGPSPGQRLEAAQTTSTLLRQGYGGHDGGQASASVSVSAEGADMSGHKAPPTDHIEPAGGGLTQP